MKSIKALARTTWILIVVAIVVIAAIGGVLLYTSGVLTPGPGVPTPDFVNANKVIIEGAGTAQYLDPHVSYYQFDYWILQNTVETLLWYNGPSATELIPLLAESMPTEVAGSNGLSWEFKLRPNIKFQDGSPLNSTAVWFSFNRLLMKDGTSGSPTKPRHGSQAAWIIQQLLDPEIAYSMSGGDSIGAQNDWNGVFVKAVLDQNFVEIVDDLTFRLHIKTPSSSLPYLLAGQWADIISPSSVIPKDYEFYNAGTWNGNYTKYFEVIAGKGNSYFCVPTEGWKMGTGPFYLDSFSATTHNWVLKKNPNYWGGPSNFALKIYPDNMVEEVDYVYQESFSTRLLDLQARTVTGVAVPTDQIYSVIDRDLWLSTKTAKSIVPGNTFYGPYANFVCDWLNFCTNVTDDAGNLLSFQPFADIRLRLAVCHAVNMTDAQFYVMNGVFKIANGLLPPDTAPEGVYNTSLTVPWKYDLKKAAELIVDAMENPRTDFTDFDGNPMPAGTIDNSFGPSKPKTIELGVPTGATDYEKIWTTIATNLNAIRDQNNTGLTFSVKSVATGQLYSLAEEHRIYAYWGGWVADYNHVTNWLGAMYMSTGTYFSWNQWNIPELDNLYDEAVAADAAGNAAELVRITNKMNRIANENAYYFWLFFEGDLFTRSSFLKGWYYNPALGVEYFGTMHY